MIDLRSIEAKCFEVILVDGTQIHVQQPTVEGFESLQILYRKADIYGAKLKNGQVKEFEELTKIVHELCVELAKLFSVNLEGITFGIDDFKKKFTYSGLTMVLGEYIKWTKSVINDPN